MSQMQQDERYSRQRDIVPAARIAECKATVIGVGAIGRQVALLEYRPGLVDEGFRVAVSG